MVKSTCKRAKKSHLFSLAQYSKILLSSNSYFKYCVYTYVDVEQFYVLQNLHSL